MPREYKLYIDDIKKSCQKILRYTLEIDFEEFRRNDLVYDAVIRNLEIIGEASKQIPDDIRSQYPSIEWRKISGLRDVISHAYFGIEDSIIWEIIKIKIPELLKAIESPGEAGAERVQLE